MLPREMLLYGYSSRVCNRDHRAMCALGDPSAVTCLTVAGPIPKS